MEIKVNFLDKLRLEAKFDDFTVVADQPIRYKGDGSAPGPFDYFLASSALCAAYFVKLYCDTRNISTEHIRLSQNNIVDPENRYAQIFKIQVQLPPDISEVDRRGILKKWCKKAPSLSLKKWPTWTKTHKLYSASSLMSKAALSSWAKTCPWNKPLPTCLASWPIWASR